MSVSPSDHHGAGGGGGGIASVGAELADLANPHPEGSGVVWTGKNG